MGHKTSKQALPVRLHDEQPQKWESTNFQLLNHDVLNAVVNGQVDRVEAWIRQLKTLSGDVRVKMLSEALCDLAQNSRVDSATTCETARILLDAGARADAHKIAKDRDTPLHHMRYPSFLEVLLSSHPNVNVVNSNKQTPLHCYVLQEKVSAEHIQLLIAAGADINAGDEQGDTPLMVAVSLGKVAIVRDGFIGTPASAITTETAAFGNRFGGVGAVLADALTWVSLDVLGVIAAYLSPWADIATITNKRGETAITSLPFWKNSAGIRASYECKELLRTHLERLELPVPPRQYTEEIEKQLSKQEAEERANWARMARENMSYAMLKQNAMFPM